MFMYILSLVVDKKLETRSMDVVTAYLYGSLDTNIYMRILVGLVEFQNSQKQPKCPKDMLHEKKSNQAQLNRVLFHP